MTRERQTGLNSYLIISKGEYLYDIDGKLTGTDLGTAIAFLWTPESVTDRIAAMERRMPWAGNLTAVRAR